MKHNLNKLFTASELGVLEIIEEEDFIKLRPKTRMEKSLFKRIADKVEKQGGQYLFSEHIGGHFKIPKRTVKGQQTL